MNPNNDEQTELLREILKWLKFSAIKEVKNILIDSLDTDQQKLIYHLSDGSRGSVEISKLANTSDTTVRRYWISWYRQGIVEPIKVRGGDRYKKTFNLEDFGLELPQMPVKRIESKTENIASDQQ